MAFSAFHGPVDIGSHSILVAFVKLKYVGLDVDCRNEKRPGWLVRQGQMIEIDMLPMELPHGLWLVTSITSIDT